jgi:FkbM family methyltransferase
MAFAERVFELRFLLGSPNPFKKLTGLIARVLWMTFRFGLHPLGRGRVIQTAGMSYGWQLWRRAVGKPVVVRLPEGSLLLCPPWSRVAGNYITVGFDEYRESLFVLDFLRPGELFVDVGANIGFYSIIAAGVTGRVMAFEPTERARAAIAASARLNGCADRITISARALSDRCGTAFFTTQYENMNQLTDAGEGTIEVEVSTLDAEVDAVPALIKIDAEGFDLTVLRGGAQRIFPQHKPAVVVELQNGSHEIRSWLLENGYELFTYEPETKSLSAFIPLVVADGVSYQEYVVAVHRDRVGEARARLTSSAVRALRPPAVRWAAA